MNLEWKSDLAVLISIPHPILALILSNDLTSIFDDDLIWVKGPIAPHTIPAVQSLDNLDTNVILASGLAALSQTIEAAVATSF